MADRNTWYMHHFPPMLRHFELGVLTRPLYCVIFPGGPCNMSVLHPNANDVGDCEVELAAGDSCTNTPRPGSTCTASTCLDGILTAGSCELPCDATGLLANAADIGDCSPTLPSRATCTNSAMDGYFCSESSCLDGVVTLGVCEDPSIDLASIISPYSGSILDNYVNVCRSGLEQGFSVALQPGQRIRINQVFNNFYSVHTLRYWGGYPGHADRRATGPVA